LPTPTSAEKTRVKHDTSAICKSLKEQVLLHPATTFTLKQKKTANGIDLKLKLDRTRRYRNQKQTH
jgi:hypothetical protein